jgi:hypothetical protein
MCFLKAIKCRRDALERIAKRIGRDYFIGHVLPPHKLPGAKCRCGAVGFIARYKTIEQISETPGDRPEGCDNKSHIEKPDIRSLHDVFGQLPAGYLSPCEYRDRDKSRFEPATPHGPTDQV